MMKMRSGKARVAAIIEEDNEINYPGVQEGNIIDNQEVPLARPNLCSCSCTPAISWRPPIQLMIGLLKRKLFLVNSRTPPNSSNDNLYIDHNSSLSHYLGDQLAYANIYTNNIGYSLFIF